MPAGHQILTTVAVGAIIMSSGGFRRESLWAQVVSAKSPVVVSNSEPLVPPARKWSLAAEPFLRIGSDEVESDVQLYRITGVVRLADGQIVVANSGSLQLVYFDEHGELITSVGGPGGGPGEFKDLWKIGAYRKDSVYAYDRVEESVTIYGSSGEFGRRTSFRHLAGTERPLLQGVLADGRFVMSTTWSLSGGESAAITIVDDLGVAADTVALVPRADFGNPRGSLFFGPLSISAAHGNQIFWGYGDTFEIHEFDTTGMVRRTINMTFEPYEITESRYQQYVDHFVQSLSSRSGNLDEMRARARREHERLRPAESLPAFRSFLVDDGGNLWVQEYPLQGVREASWHVFSAEGIWLTTVAMPSKFTLYQVGDMWALGVFRDTLDVEYVVMHDLRKP
jgi:hypothetical protein